MAKSNFHFHFRWIRDNPAACLVDDQEGLSAEFNSEEEFDPSEPVPPAEILTPAITTSLMRRRRRCRISFLSVRQKKAFGGKKIEFSG